MFDQPFVILIFIGLALKSVGFVVRDELLLRTLVFTGICFDIAFYFLQSPAIWGSVLANSILVSVNGALIVIIMFERSTWGMNDREISAFKNFKTLNPGQFRRINRAARWTVAPYDTEILIEGQASEKMYFIEGEIFTILKGGRSFNVVAPAFAGELMFLQGGKASATVVVPKGTVYAAWDVAQLKAMMEKSRPLANALVARFSEDLAEKVRHSVPLAEVPAQAAE